MLFVKKFCSSYKFKSLKIFYIELKFHTLIIQRYFLYSICFCINTKKKMYHKIKTIFFLYTFIRIHITLHLKENTVKNQL